MTRKITMGMGDGSIKGRGGNQITLGMGTRFEKAFREVLRLCSKIATRVTLVSRKFRWTQTN